MNKENLAIESFKVNQELIKFVDQKAGIVLVVFGFILSIYIKTIENLTFVNPFQLNNIFGTLSSLFIFILSISLGVTLLLQIYFITFKIILPRNAKHYKKSDDSLFYFEHIKNLGREKYFNQFNNLKGSEILSQILCQNYELSVIITKKNRFLTIAIKLLFYTIIQLVLLLLLKSL